MYPIHGPLCIWWCCLRLCRAQCAHFTPTKNINSKWTQCANCTPSNHLKKPPLYVWLSTIVRMRKSRRQTQQAWRAAPGCRPASGEEILLLHSNCDPGAPGWWWGGTFQNYPLLRSFSTSSDTISMCSAAAGLRFCSLGEP